MVLRGEDARGVRRAGSIACRRPYLGQGSCILAKRKEMAKILQRVEMHVCDTAVSVTDEIAHLGYSLTCHVPLLSGICRF
jgi:hypothetical protein